MSCTLEVIYSDDFCVKRSVVEPHSLCSRSSGEEVSTAFFRLKNAAIWTRMRGTVCHFFQAWKRVSMSCLAKRSSISRSVGSRSWAFWRISLALASCLDHWWKWCRHPEKCQKRCQKTSCAPLPMFREPIASRSGRSAGYRDWFQKQSQSCSPWFPK